MSFGKQIKCPTTQQTLSYIEGSLGFLDAQRVAQHLHLCDFCGAEAQLLARHATNEGDHGPCPTPPLISFLNVRTLASDTPRVSQRHAA